MSKSPASHKKTEEGQPSPLKLLQENQGPTLKKLFNSSEKLNRTARILIDNIHQQPSGRNVELFIAGTGAVGGTLVEQIGELKSDLSLTIIGACDSDHFFWDSDGVDPQKLPSLLAEGQPTRWEQILDRLHRHNHKRLIFVDATGSADVARLYPEIMKAHIHIATPSKLANTFEQSFYEDLQQLSQNNNIQFRYEPTVGAGLPVISTITDLLASGDRVTEISGVASGTMTYLFTQLEQGVLFSEAVKTAREKGYAEPDPRDDLSGEDVARKFITLARTIGMKVERSDLAVESLVPDHLKSVDRELFLQRIQEVDDHWKARIESASQQNKTLRYVGKLTNHDISVGIQEVPVDSPLGKLGGTDNLFQVSTNRYSASPIVIQGPGAGKEVTAAGVLSDILKIGTTIVSEQ